MIWYTNSLEREGTTGRCALVKVLAVSLEKCGVEPASLAFCQGCCTTYNYMHNMHMHMCTCTTNFD